VPSCIVPLTISVTQLTRFAPTGIDSFAWCAVVTRVWRK
jgi:hypothetical protein